MTVQTNFRYVALADEIQDDIMAGRFRPGEKLPSLRQLHNRLGLSITTVHQAYIELEKRGRVEAREKSGFYVSPLLTNPLPRPREPRNQTLPSKVKINELAQTIQADLQATDILQLGAAVASRDLMPVKQLARIMKSMSMEELETTMGTYDCPEGSSRFRNALAKQMLGHVSKVLPKDIITTSGCLEAVSLSLRAVAAPGDTILVEAPVFHCFLQLIEDLNLYVLEMPGCPDKGMNPDAFETVVRENNIKACLLNTNFQNPLGSLMSADAKKAVLEIADTNDLPIIEDDIYGDLYFGPRRPSTFKSMDAKGSVLYCSSFSKTLAPGLRAGWTLPGRFREKVIRLKLNSQLACPGIGHRAVARFLETGAYDRHLRRLRNQIKNQVSAIAIAIANHFPKETRVTFPRGGMMIWVELNKAVDTMEIYQQARQRGISILPGKICSSSDRYSHCLRLSCGIKWNTDIEKGLALLGRLIKAEYKKKGVLR